MMKTTPVLGLDVGGVIVDRAAQDTDTSFFGNRPMETPAVPDAIESIAELVEQFEFRVHIISKAGPKISTLTRQWLGKTGFFDLTGLRAGNVHFVRRRPDKAPLCEKFGVTHFVDDRLDVLAHMETVDRRYLFLGGLGENEAPDQIPRWATVSTGWDQLRRLIAADLS